MLGAVPLWRQRWTPSSSPGVRPRLHDRRGGRPDQPAVIRRTLAEGRAVGLASGLGVATADATYGAIAAFGLTAITDVLVGGGRRSA